MGSRVQNIRDRAVEEIKYASQTISQNARTIGIGLVLIVYAVAFTDEHAEIVEEHKVELVIAGAFGVLCVVLDYLHYYFMIWENRSLMGTLRAQRDQVLALAGTDRAAATELARQYVSGADRLSRRNPFRKAREFCFHAKFACAMLGALIIVYLTTILLKGP